MELAESIYRRYALKSKRKGGEMYKVLDKVKRKWEHGRGSEEAKTCGVQDFLVTSIHIYCRAMQRHIELIMFYVSFPLGWVR